MTEPISVFNSHSHVEERVVDGTEIPPNITLNNCVEVHIGPKYVHNQNITINQGLPCVDDTDSIHSNDQIYRKSCRSMFHKCIKIPCGVHIKVLLYGASFLLIVLIITYVSWLLKGYQPRHSVPLDSEDYPLDKRFVMRDSWGAAPACTYLPNNTLPVGRVIFIHTVSSGTCNNFASCKNIVLGIQDFHRHECTGSETVGDIGYNFVIGSDGHIFVGRGWDKIGAHTYGSNTGSIGVAFVGDFRRDEPSKAMLDSAKTLLEVGVKRKKLTEEYQLFGHCQVHSGFPYSPGVNILEKIESWPHWNNSNTKNCADFSPS